jgi:hypothetical protein
MLVLAAMVAGFVPAASASVEIRDSQTTELLQEFDKAKCKVKKGTYRFAFLSLPANDLYTLDVFIHKAVWDGFGHTYNIFYGSGPVDLDVFGPGQGERYSNEFGIPGTPPGTVGAGGVKLSRNGKRMSIGVFALNDASFTRGVSVTGAAKCKYSGGRGG